MADQFFFDAEANNTENFVLDDGASNEPNNEAPTFSQFNNWALVVESDVEDEADKDFVENNSEQGLEKKFNSFQPQF